MRHLETKTMAGFNDTRIDTPEAFSVILSNGTELGYDDVVSITPAVTSDYDGYARPQLVLGTDEGLPRWDESRYYPVGRLATFHGRNLEVLADRVSIQDHFGNTFNSLCIKGSDFSDPHLFRSATASREYIVHGLQESLVMERIMRASKLLREHGVGTEYICGLSVPESFPLDKQGKAIDNKTATPFSDFLETLASRYAAESQNGKSALEIKTDLIERFSDCDYLITYRALDCPYRFGELLDGKQFAKLKEYRKKMTDNPSEIEEIENQSLTEYLDDKFVPTLARNLAKMHKIGLVHGFLHRDNITALGSIIDLDSVRGEALGLGDTFENPKLIRLDVKLRAKMEDIFQCINNIETVGQYVDNPRVSAQALAEKFLSTYIHEAFDTEEEQDAFVAELLGHAYTISYLSDDASAMHHNSQLIFGAYVNLHPDILEAVREDIPLPDEKIDIHNSRRKASQHFSLFPTALIKGWRKQILKDPTPQQLTDDDTYQEASFNNMRLMIKNQLAIHFIAELFIGRRDDNVPVRQMMTALGCMLGELAPGDNLDVDPDINERLEEIQAYFYQQNKLFLSRLVRYERPDIFGKEAHEALTPETQRELRDFTAAEAWLDGYMRGSVLYLQNDAQYAKIFDELGINENTEIEYVNMEGVNATREYQGKTTIVLADYTKASLVACHPWKEHSRRELFTPEILTADKDTPDIKPTIMIRDVFGTPKIQIISHANPNYEEAPVREKAAYQDLLEKTTPSLVEPRQLVLPVS
jgi:hypothetical protein